MGQVFYKLFYHVTWSTHLRRRLILPGIEPHLFAFLQGKAKQNHCYIHALNGTEDHVHAVVTIPPSVSVSEVIGKLKGSSSYFLNKELKVPVPFQWQDGFGVLSVSEGALKSVVQYVANQKQHHANSTVKVEFECDSEVEIR